MGAAVAEIEYAVLAQFASVAEDGTLTVVGAHRRIFEVAGVPGQHVLCVAGRVLLARREPPPVLSLGAMTPDGDVPVVARWPLEVPDVPMEDGRRPAAFAATLVAPVPSAGEYALTLHLDDDLLRTLPFTVVDTAVDTAVSTVAGASAGPPGPAEAPVERPAGAPRRRGRRSALHGSAVG